MSPENIARLDYYIDKIYGGSKEENIIDSVTDLQHLAKRHGIDFDDLLWIARIHFDEESEDIKEDEHLTKKLKVVDELVKLFRVKVKCHCIRTNIRDHENPPDGLYVVVAKDLESCIEQFNSRVFFGCREDFIIEVSETTPLEILEELDSLDFKSYQEGVAYYGAEKR
jgi:hypothetical protein